MKAKEYGCKCRDILYKVYCETEFETNEERMTAAEMTGKMMHEVQNIMIEYMEEEP